MHFSETILKLMIRACGKMVVLDEMLSQLKANGNSNYFCFVLFVCDCCLTFCACV
jgi:hypothetical protein